MVVLIANEDHPKSDRYRTDIDALTDPRRTRGGTQAISGEADLLGNERHALPARRSAMPMEMAYRLVVSEMPLIEYRNNVIDDHAGG